MSLRNLEIFAEVCQHMNMSRAAEKLYISQSSVSQAIAELEKQYQVKLFERLSRKLYLTDAGKELLFYANQMVHLIKQIDRKMQDMSSTELIRIGACTTIAFYLMNPLLDRFQEICPAVRATVEVGNSSQLEQKILNSQLDLAFVQDISNAKEMSRECALADHLVLVCHKDHPLADKEVSEEALDGLSFVAREPGSGTRRLLDHIFSQKGIVPEYAWVCNSIASMKDAVLHKRGICLLSQHLVHEELEQGQMAEIRVKGREFNRRFFLIRHKDKYKTREIEAFIELCRERETDYT